jgi:hypothetical protein
MDRKLLMVIEIVHIQDIAVLETKDDPPIAGHGDSVEALQTTS